MANTTLAIESLAAQIGENVYIDIAKWHLYLRDAHLHTVVAQQLYPMLENGNLDADRVRQVLQGISVKLGGGKREVPLADLIPMQCQVQLMDVLEEFQRDM
ncbi:MAG: DUF3181 family protein [Microcoleus sp. PH2017_10_PVI_O_A]|uniref:DUF3181 family protein n=1 Tax=unclassified Microcoleus TaxID=2642155 RepID=UPI001DD31B04|nr:MULTISPECIES: DUF3181 family protein [unclassified Microcoleus]TAE81978.1 MAG: DUF3181 family protein [Oscillatoriales cyanobacterium]MCC3406696.1 DUF3181 family protein [Microcoleus sp. PH2017_10_PVI_O_A]MCC3460692.1 DUF3181 family protein [Microcoleus sp. PH2017_11_PCY_U_A]MCC3479255.1 DUF3181 family protein [Microcoleus sp. PH2017_12_PCY_D_A]MCC3528194.1 DUF3181 family protein [Microcoleus sp. PH2017_21_RUC_O_A]